MTVIMMFGKLRSSFWRLYFSSISIFNRFGKLLKNMSLNQNFWDGTYNGIKLPTNDYWYRIELVRSDNTVLSRTGHFTLRR